MNYEELRALDPRVRAVESAILMIKPSARFCSNELWYADGGFRQQLSFVEKQYGWQEHGAATSMLFSMLPNCKRGCRCRRLKA